MDRAHKFTGLRVSLAVALAGPDQIIDQGTCKP